MEDFPLNLTTVRSPGAAGRRLVAAALLALMALAVSCRHADQTAGRGEKALLARRDKIYGVKFINETTAFIVGYPGICLRTDDRGQTFRKIEVPTREALYDIDFADAKNGAIVGRTGTVLATSDGGATWKAVDVKDPETGQALQYPLFGVSFGDEKHGVAVGKFGIVIVTADGGKSWKSEQLRPMKSASINAVAMKNGTYGCFVGEYPTWEAELAEDITLEQLSNMFCTHDSGATWQLVKTGVPNHMYDIVFSGDKEIWISATKGALVVSEDDGQTFKVIDTSVPFHLYGLAKTDAVIAVGDGGTILEYRDGKTTVRESERFVWFDEVDFADNAHGIAVGGRGAVAVTSDGGKTWQSKGHTP
jgi:photosystem II stability/assembly factor-like uncharacterized protein